MLSEGLIINLILILTVAWFMGTLFVRFGFPVILGELLAGLILGPTLLGLVSTTEPLELMAEFGIFFLMFYSGLEMDPKELLEHIWPALFVATGGFVLPFALGVIVALVFGGTMYQALFIGMGLSVTSLAVQARILHDMNVHRTKLGHIIIGAAIADDILALITLSLLLGLAGTGSISPLLILIVLLKVVGFFTASILITHYVFPKIVGRLDLSGAKSFTFALISAMVMGYLAVVAGLHIIIGAFVAGQFVRKEVKDLRILERVSNNFYVLSYGFLAPIFFVSLSFHLDFKWSLYFIVLAVVLTLIAMVGKVFGCAAGGYISGLGKTESTIVGFGMNGRGAVELIVAAVALKLSGELLSAGKITEPLLTGDQFSALILMAFVTTFVAPISMKWIIRRVCSRDVSAEFCQLPGWTSRDH
ncbi:MAG: cation:proton antiporter [Thermodesulfobacteriota bacterium]